MMRRRLLLAAAALFITAHAAEIGDGDRVLARLARVAELYRDTALGFACEETIVATGATTHRVQFAYIFVKGEDGRLRDFRTWRMGTTAKERGREVDPRDYKIPRYLASAYLWAFVFRSDRQPHYKLKLLGEDTALDRPALKIQFVPVPPLVKGVNDWAGLAWVDRDTSQMLKFESYSPADWNARLHIAEDLAAASSRDPHDEKEPYVVDKIVTEFGFEKNGMRFPSHVEMSTTEATVKYGHAGDPLRERVTQKVVQDYAHFEFFSVRSSDEIMRFVNGDSPLPPAPTSPGSR
jgi:hypothetical protein